MQKLTIKLNRDGFVTPDFAVLQNIKFLVQIMDKAANGKNHCAIRYDHQNFLTPLVNGFKFWSPEAIWRALKDVPAFKPWIP